MLYLATGCSSVSIQSVGVGVIFSIHCASALLVMPDLQVVRLFMELVTSLQSFGQNRMRWILGEQYQPKEKNFGQTSPKESQLFKHFYHLSSQFWPIWAIRAKNIDFCSFSTLANTWSKTGISPLFQDITRRRCEFCDIIKFDALFDLISDHDVWENHSGRLRLFRPM